MHHASEIVFRFHLRLPHNDLTQCVQVLVIDYKLTYPSGTATAVLINGFHTTQGDKNSKYVC